MGTNKKFTDKNFKCYYDQIELHKRLKNVVPFVKLISAYLPKIFKFEENNVQNM